MAELNLAYWQNRTPTAEYAPVQGDVVPNSVYLLTSTTSPLPAASFFGYWQWFDSPAELVDYLRCAGVPDMLDIWFERHGPNDASPRIDPRQVLIEASAKGLLTEDIPVCERVLDVLDQAAQAAPSEAMAGATHACAIFSERFGRTGTWDLQLVVFPDATAAAANVLEDSLAPLPADEWRALTSDVVTGDSTAAQRFAQVMRELEYL